MRVILSQLQKSTWQRIVSVLSALVTVLVLNDKPQYIVETDRSVVPCIADEKEASKRTCGCCITAVEQLNVPC